MTNIVLSFLILCSILSFFEPECQLVQVDCENFEKEVFDFDKTFEQDKIFENSCHEIEVLYKVKSSSCTGNFIGLTRLLIDGDLSVISSTMDGEKITFLLDAPQLNMLKDSILNINKGCFIQECKNYFSYGGMNNEFKIFSVKIKGNIVFQYYSSQYDWSDMNNEDKLKIEKILEIRNSLNKIIDSHEKKKKTKKIKYEFGNRK